MLFAASYSASEIMEIKKATGRCLIQKFGRKAESLKVHENSISGFVKKDRPPCCRRVAGLWMCGRVAKRITDA
ncbi:hypothetical protein BCV53_04085 [Parageobacillus thermoglucosidasius]|uniref:Uncharacterized protein n=1 Tax=Parageobacillus thermoglucosidasius TaxID=1426 RepID=A0AAN1D5U7_PARTM|nr:hypothetical protein [Parageobacillus thermoglucosidasius]GAJ43462.1 hypothetical protein GT2_10_00220 [Parageobacillus thermoglucosidasius NBRC 107763]ALF09270.1 hypothetical protein AOT13_04070 [Parageobacillus thermoglucosidasius]ANZ29352.1 hypothetical protein BCV53_04085 [Parageobacillus thermoglucosidasius]APM80091.1 hypothetical protein BCV54_04090 [Parageobacillus thermoglucosidasius]KJX67397.1 hypothetical protein WH82_17860 [Parageobacillus thermoglucosidasius]